MRTSSPHRPARAVGALLALLLALTPQLVVADELTEELLDATVEELDVTVTSEPLRDRIAVRLEGAVAVDAIADEVLDAVTTSTDPDTIGPALAANLVREQARWADVGPLWTRAREMLGDGDGTCALGDDEPCGLLLRTQLQTETALQLAERADCDEECAQRLERLQERLERTIRQVEQLGPGVIGPDTDVAAVLRNAEQARLRLVERIGVARGEGPGPANGGGPDGDSAGGPGPANANDDSSMGQGGR